MASVSLFDLVAEELVKQTHLNDLVARGALRKALAKAGLDPLTVTAAQMAVVMAKTMPAVLTKQGVSDPDGVCAALGTLAKVVKTHEVTTSVTESAEATFRRLIRS
jgi:hypothetical protein